MKSLRLFFSTLLSCFVLGASAQCPNLDFSYLNFTYWLCQTSSSSGTYNTAYNALTWSGSAAVSGRHTVMTDIYGYDPRTCDGSPNEYLALIPDGFNQSCKPGGLCP